MGVGVLGCCLFTSLHLLPSKQCKHVFWVCLAQGKWCWVSCWVAFSPPLFIYFWTVSLWHHGTRSVMGIIQLMESLCPYFISLNEGLCLLLFFIMMSSSKLKGIFLVDLRETDLNQKQESQYSFFKAKCFQCVLVFLCFWALINARVLLTSSWCWNVFP